MDIGVIGCVWLMFFEVSVCLFGGEMRSFKYMWMNFSRSLPIGHGAAMMGLAG